MSSSDVGINPHIYEILKMYEYANSLFLLPLICCHLNPVCPEVRTHKCTLMETHFISGPLLFYSHKNTGENEQLARLQSTHELTRLTLQIRKV